jgi:hypothetical protein
LQDDAARAAQLHQSLRLETVMSPLARVDDVAIPKPEPKADAMNQETPANPEPANRPRVLMRSVTKRLLATSTKPTRRSKLRLVTASGVAGAKFRL